MRGVVFAYSNSNTIINNVISSDLEFSMGAVIDAFSSNNKIYNNLFNNTLTNVDINRIFFPQNYWNTTKDCTQKNIVGYIMSMLGQLLPSKILSILLKIIWLWV